MNTLYHQLLCPFSRKTRIVLCEKNVKFELREVASLVRSQGHKIRDPGEMLPVFTTKHKKPIVGHSAIIGMMLDVYGENLLFPQDVWQKAETRRLVELFDFFVWEEITKMILHEKMFKRMLEGQGNSGSPDVSIIRNAQSRLHFFLDYLNHLLRKNFNIASEKFTLADWTLVSHLSCIDYLIGLPLEGYICLKRWYLRIKSRPCFYPLLHESVPGIKPSKLYADLDF